MRVGVSGVVEEGSSEAFECLCVVELELAVEPRLEVGVGEVLLLLWGDVHGLLASQELDVVLGNLDCGCLSRELVLDGLL